MGRKKHEFELIRDWVIYKIVSPSNRVYIGKASSFNERIGYYRRLQCKQQVILYKSLLKYGFDAHIIEQIDSFTSDNSCANSKEMFWIRTYMSNYSKYPEQRGMNLTDGGEGAIGRKATDETKTRMKEAAIRREQNPEYNKFRGKHTGQALENMRLSQAVKRSKEGYVPPNTGKKFSEEAKLKMAFKKVKHPICQYDLYGKKIDEFPSICEAVRQTGIAKSSICNLLKNTKNPKMGYTFKYKSEPIFSNFSFQRRVFNQKEIKTA